MALVLPVSHPVPLPAGRQAGWVILLHLLLVVAAVAAAGGGKSHLVRGSGGEPPVAMATAGQSWQLGFTRC